MKILNLLLAFLLPVSVLADNLDGLYPMPPGGYTSVYNANYAHTGATAMNTAGQMVAFMGYLYINGAPTSTKLCSTSGCKIAFRPGTVTAWSGADDTVIVSLQDIDATNGPVGRPDESADVSDDLISGTDSLSTGTWKEVTMSSGTKTLTHGQLIAIVFDLSAVSGATVNISYQASGASSHWPLVASKSGGSWAAVAGAPNAIIYTDDGTLAWIVGSVNWAATGTKSFSDSSNPDEFGLYCSAPYDMVVNGYWFFGSLTDNGGATVTMYKDPTGTPTQIGTQLTLDADQTQSSGVERPWFMNVPDFSVPANMPWVLALKSTVAGTNSSLSGIAMNANSDLAIYSGGINCYEMGRQNGTGAFSATNSSKNLPVIGVSYRRITSAGCRTFFKGGTCAP